MPKADLYFSRGGFGYGQFDYTDIGQAFPLVGSRNDEKLIRLGHLREVEKGTKLETCGKCGAQFINMQFLNRHGDARHRGPLTPEREDQLAEQNEKLAETAMPLKLDQTKASRGAPKGARA